MANAPTSSNVEIIVRCPKCDHSMNIGNARLFVTDTTPCSCGQCFGESFSVSLFNTIRCEKCKTEFEVVFNT